MEENNWRECVSWLSRVSLISPDHILNSATSKMIDFAKFLRDGVMLCKLLYLLDESSIDLSTINQRPQNAQFLCMKNIKKFLYICSHHFDIRELELFEPQMLFELTDFGKVLTTLSKLSRCPKVAALNLEGFPKGSNQNIYDNDAYRLLQDSNGHAVENGGAASIVSSSEDCGLPSIPRPSSIRSRRNIEDIYESLCYVTLKPQAEKTPDKRELCIRELLETEKNYSDALGKLIINFYKPLKEVLSETDYNVIFFNIKEMFDIHNQLNRALNEARNPNISLTISQVFMNWQEKLLMYGEYCANISQAQLLLEKLMADNTLIRQKIKECETTMSDRQYHLRDYLVVPLQRILKYHLLLKELLKHTTESHEEHTGLKKAYDAMLDVAEYVNEVKRDREALQIIDELQTSITDIPDDLRDLKSMGRLRHDGEIKIECHPDKNKQRFVFVFDKQMIMCKQSKEERYIFKDSVVLENCKIDNTTALSSTMGALKRANSFFIVVNDCAKAYTIITKNEESKRQWLKALYDAIDNVRPGENVQKNHQFNMITFKRIGTKCDICRKLFKGCFFQGYECNICRISSHKNCLKNTKRCRELNFASGVPIASILQPIQSPTPDYWNLQVREHAWWADRMTREEACTLLCSADEGCFMLRWSDKHNQPVVSLKALNEVKHMRVNRHRGHFFFSDNRSFPSIVELINYYRHNNLSECFQGLERTLTKPIYDTAVALFDYVASGQNQLSLTACQRLVVIGREGEELGWWKGRVSEKTGYFPKEYVKVETDPSLIWFSLRTNIMTI